MVTETDSVTDLDWVTGSAMAKDLETAMVSVREAIQ